MNFVPVSFVDASYCTAAYTTRYRARLQPSLDGEMEAIQLMRDGKPSSILGEWKSAKALLSKVRNAAAPFMKGKPAVLESANIISIGVDKALSWKKPDPGGPWAMLTLLPSPGAVLISGTEMHLPPVGQLTLISRDSFFSIVNTGPVPVVFLNVEARMPDADVPMEPD